MKTLKFVENDDGSATVTLEISEEENNLLIQYAITNILKEEIEKIQECDSVPDGFPTKEQDEHYARVALKSMESKKKKINGLINDIKQGKVIDKKLSEIGLRD